MPMKYYKQLLTGKIISVADHSTESIPNDAVEMTTEEFNDHLIDLQTKVTFDELSYDAKRRSEYPPFTVYLDAVVKDDQAGIAAYIAACQAVKAKYPKS
jgi:hypothetical protein